MSKKLSISTMVLNVFEKQKEVRLADLYKELSANPQIDEIVKPSELKHRIRSCIYSMSKSNKITRIAGATYRFVD